jgi:hypothetical protein
MEFLTANGTTFNSKNRHHLEETSEFIHKPERAEKIKYVQGH